MENEAFTEADSPFARMTHARSISVIKIIVTIMGADFVACLDRPYDFEDYAFA